MIKHYFHFITLGEVEPIESSEPWGADGVGFSTKRDNGRKAVDTVFSGNGEAQFTLKRKDNHPFEKMLTCWERKGSNMRVKYMIDFGEGIVIVGDVDGKTLKTDKVNEINFTVIQETNQAVFKRRFDTEINVLSGKDIKGNALAVPPLHNILLKSPPVTLTSSWNTSSIDKYINVAGNYPYLAISRSQIDYDVKDSLTPFISGETSEADAINTFLYIRAQDNLSNLKLKADMDILFDYRQQGGNSNTKASIELKWRVFNEPYPDNNATIGQGTIYAKVISGTTNQLFSLPEEVNGILSDMPRGSVLAIYFKFFWDDHTITRTRWNMNNVKLTLTAAASSYSTVIKGFRYIDVLNYASKAVSGLPVIAPRWEEGGELYNQFITSPSLMRNKFEKFTVSNKKLYEDGIIPEENGDYQVNDDHIFVGIYEDFYRDFKCAEFKQTVLSGFEAGTAQDQPNQVNIEFDNYASQKENVEKNSAQITSGAAQFIIDVDTVEDSREISIGMSRDALLIRKYQDYIFLLSDSDVSQDDDKLILIDCVDKTTSVKFTETSRLRHIKDVNVDNKLTLTMSTEENETFDWANLGIDITSSFNILNGANQGQYKVQDIDGLDLILLRTSNTDVTNISFLNTTYEYFVGNSVTIMNRTNEGFTSISNIDDPTRAINLDFSIRRIMERFYKNSLGTDTFFADSNIMRNTLYKNNGAATINGVREDSNFIPSTPILTPYTRELTVFARLREYWAMQQSIREDRGFVRCYDTDGFPVDVFISEATWTNEQPKSLRGKIEISGVQMYRPFLVNIVATQTYVNFNDTITPSSFSFRQRDNGYIEFLDATGKRLFSPVQYNRVQINNSGAASSPGELGQWLSVYSI